ncbi:Ger(x)C family spore germination protein [Clostridium sp. cel8]|jgi:Ger(x)C family germination protein/spore germination protein (amino acid permease)|uniref:Ger(x)C family spore germination protein n=1 Tax=unclassified Clostridium TaxID=2614128 RepID=UPI0015F4F81B|nr:Ger(x)C family spore germination protein [Clostridium sp. cel8]MBA5851461.1 Ger(x)C family spore germination protein [Clostridium sp. cel8]
MQDKNFISSFGLFSTIIVTVIGIGIFSYPQQVISIIGTDSWIITILGGILVYILLYIIWFIIKMNGYNKFYFILKNSFGKILGSIFAIIFIIYNIISISFGMRVFTEVIKMYLLEKTPTEFIFIVTILTSIYLITSGLKNVVKFNEVSFWIMFVPIIIVLTLTLNQVDFSNILPVFIADNPHRYLESLKTSIYSFSGIEIIYVMAPFIKKNFSPAKTSAKSMIFITLFYTVAVIIVLSIFSSGETKMLLWPTMTMITSISVNSIFIQKWEGIVMALWIMFYFTTFSNVYYFSCDILKDVFNLKSIKIPCIALGVLIYEAALYPKNIASVYDIGNRYFLALFVFNIIILPIIIFLFTKFRKKSLKRIVPLILICVLFTGCWDRTEIENKEMISIIGVDSGEDIDKSGEQYLKKIHLTFGMPDLSELGPDKGKQSEDKYIDSEGYSFQDAVSKARLKSSRSIKFSHTGLLVFSEDIINHPDVFKQVLDYLHREPSLNRNMYIVLAKGSAEECIKSKTDLEKNAETYIGGLIQNDYKNSQVIPVTLNDFLIQMNENGNSLLPAIVINKTSKTLEIQGSAAIKNFKVKGFLNPEETANLELLRGKLEGSNKTIYLDKYPVDIDINNTSRKIAVSEKDGKLIFNVKLNIESQLKDYYLDKKVFSINKLNYIQKKFNSSIKKECEYALDVSKDLEIDPVGFDNYLKKYHYNIWKKVKDSWDKNYKNSIIDVEVDTQIRRIGIVK